MTSDGMPTAAEVRRLEEEADALLKADAGRQGYIRGNGRGFTAYARAYGITTKKILETTYKHEAAISMLTSEGSVEDQFEWLVSGSRMDKVVHGVDAREEAE